MPCTHEPSSQALLPGNLTEDRYPDMLGMSIWADLRRGGAAVHPSETNRKASPARSPARGPWWPWPASGYWLCSLRPSLSLKACKAPRILAAFFSPPSEQHLPLLLNGSFLRIRDQAARIRVTGGQAPPVSRHRPHLWQRVN